jgi:hypothetical protein
MDLTRIDGERETLEDRLIRDGGVEVFDFNHDARNPRNRSEIAKIKAAAQRIKAMKSDSDPVTTRLLNPVVTSRPGFNQPST